MEKITCDAEQANEAMRHRCERFEALACHVSRGIRDGIASHNKHEASHGFSPAAPEEISQSMAQSVEADILKSDPAAIERFIEDLHLSVSGRPFERMCTL